jgi:multiple sugar transport system permease protein
LSRRLSPRTVSLWVVTAGMILVGLIIIAPLVWLIVQSLTPQADAFELPPSWLPDPFSLENYDRLQEQIPFARMALNSLIVAVLSTIGAVSVSVLAAYAFSRFRFRGDRFLLILFLGALMVPVQTTIIPLYILMRNLHLVDNLASLWLPAFINVFAIFFLRQYFNTVPRELDEAAKLDGASHLWFLLRILIPLSGPGIAAVSVLTFEAAWNNYFGPLIFLNSRENMTLPIGLVTLQADRNGASVTVFAGIAAVVIPVIVVYLLVQRWFVEGVASTGIRG